jgi:hypothetical protein
LIKTRLKPATKAGKREIFGEMRVVKAKPARTIVKEFPVSALTKSFLRQRWEMSFRLKTWSAATPGTRGYTGGQFPMAWQYLQSEGVVSGNCFPYTVGSGTAQPAGNSALIASPGRVQR